MTTPTDTTSPDTTSPAEMFLAAAERVTNAVDFLARDWHRLNGLLADTDVYLFRTGQMREAEKAIALLLCGNAELETVTRVRRTLNKNQLPIC